MNKITRENYPASRLPEELREGIDPNGRVTVKVTEVTPPDDVMSLEQIFATRRPPFRSGEEIVSDIRRPRDEWED